MVAAAEQCIKFVEDCVRRRLAYISIVSHLVIPELKFAIRNWNAVVLLNAMRAKPLKENRGRYY